jgi:hypothetical protein
MEFIIDAQSRDIFDNVFAFWGTLSSEGFVLSLDGQVFNRTVTDPKLLIGQKFSETVYWQASEHDSEILENSITEAAQGMKSKVLLDFRVSANEVINIELYNFYLPPKMPTSVCGFGIWQKITFSLLRSAMSFLKLRRTIFLHLTLF